MLIDRSFGHSGQLLDCLLSRATREVDRDGDNSDRRRESECESDGYGLAKEERCDEKKKREQCSDDWNVVQKKMKV